MISLKDLYWLAGLLEGEGTFYQESNKPRAIKIQVKSNDKDVIERIAKLFGKVSSADNPKWYRNTNYPYKKVMWCAVIAGAEASAWMMTLYPLMSIRRKQKIKEILVGYFSSYSKNLAV